MKNYNEMAESVLKRRDAYKMKQRKITQRITVALCCGVFIFGGIGIMKHTNLSTFDVGKQEDDQQNGIADLEAVKNYVKEQTGGRDENSSYEHVPYDSEDGSVNEEAVEDEDNYIESSDICQMLETSLDVYGGSYINNNGEFVVWLTENTPENRAAFCRDFGRDESNTIFHTGQYGYAYLSNLQDKISQAMVNKEIPFVVSSALSDMTNRIYILVTTEDPELINKVLAYDTIGGAIVVEYSKGASVEDLKGVSVKDLEVTE